MRHITLDNLLFQHKKSVVYYSSPELLIYSDFNSNTLTVETSKGDISKIKVRKSQEGKSCKIKDGVLLTFGGEETVIIKPDGSHDLFNLNNRYIVTDVFSFEDTIIFGSILGMFFHFVIYNLETKSKNQTASAQAVTLSYKITEDRIYALYGNSQIACYDHSGKLVWKKFEPHYVIPGLSIYKGGLVYSANNQIKITNGKTTESITVPGIRMDKIEGTIGNIVYGVCGNRQNIFAFDINKRELLYEVVGEKGIQIKKLLITSGMYKDKNKPSNVIFYSTDDKLGMVDLDEGTIKFYIGIPKIKNMVSNEELIVTTHLGESHLLRYENAPSVIEL